MREQQFKNWLLKKGCKPNTINNNVSCCLRIEYVYGSLDDIIALNRVDELRDELTYSKDDERFAIPPKHKIDIPVGNIRNITGQLKSSLNNYVRFYKSQQY